MKNNRRQFLKNTSLALAAVGITGIAKPAKAAKNDAIECDKTTLDFYGEGPFYTNNPPDIQNNLLATTGEPGTPIIVSGRVYNLDCAQFIPETDIDVWHANDAGEYDNVGYNLRGITKTNPQGFYMFQTVMPGKYLNGNQFRPAHIHFKITPPNFPTLTTQLYFEGDTSIPDDAAASITSGQFDAQHRIIPLSPNSDGVLEGVWDIVINGSGISGTSDLHLDKGIVYHVSPNPISTEANIRYGIFKKAKVGIHIHDLNGHLVANLEDRVLPKGQYDALWRPDSLVNSGTYLVTLKVNDLQIHYKKVYLKK